MYLKHAFLIFIIFACPFSYTMELAKKSNNSSQEQSTDSCAICLEPLLAGQVMCACDKKHAIHSSCAMDLLSTDVAESNVVKCPLCRVPCEDNFLKSLRLPQLHELIKKIREKTKPINNELKTLREQNGLLRRENEANPRDSAYLHAFLSETVSRIIDNEFNRNVLERTKGRMELHEWTQKERAKLNAYKWALVGYSLFAGIINYVSPFWTGYIADPEKGPEWSNVLPWATMRNIFTQMPLYAIGATFLDYQNFKLNMQEIEKRLDLAREWKSNSHIKELEDFKKRYKKNAITDQIIWPAVSCGIVVSAPLIFEKVFGIENSHSTRENAILGATLGVLGSVLVRKVFAHNNQKWFDEKKPKFDDNITFHHHTITLKSEFLSKIPR